MAGERVDIDHNALVKLNDASSRLISVMMKPRFLRSVSVASLRRLYVLR